MNSPEGKRLLSLVREGDYAHAGEEEAINLMLRSVPKDPARRVLDVGCGRGGTAAYVHQNGWGLVTGVDIDATTISDNQGRLPHLAFYCVSSDQCAEMLSPGFSLIYMMNAFYAFPEQEKTLAQCRALGTRPARLLIFDYEDTGSFHDSAFAHLEETAHWHPPRSNELKIQAERQGWKFVERVDLHAEYLRWYAALLGRFDRRRDVLTRECGEDAFAIARDFYQALYRALERGWLTGSIHAFEAA